MKQKGLKTLAVALSTALVVTMMPSNATMAAKASKKVKLSVKKITLTVGKKKTLKLKNNKKKVKWTVTSGKGKVTLKKKKKTSVVIVAKKAGTAKVQAKVGKKKYVCKVTVKKATAATKAPNKPTVVPTAVPTAVPTVTPNYAVTGAEGKDAAEVAAIDTMVTAQLAGNAKVPTDLNDSRYKWNADGKLVEIDWSECEVTGKNMSDFSGFEHLEKLDVSGNSAISGTFNTNKLVNLTELKCYDTNIDKLEIDNNKKLVELDCHGDQLGGNLDVSNNTALERLYCSGNNITTLDVSACTKLEMLYCNRNMLISLKADGLKALKELDCSINQLKGDESFNVTGDSALTKLDCSYNELTTIDLTGLTALQTLECYGEEVEDGSADGDYMELKGLSDCTQLTQLDCSYQPMQELDLKDMNKLETVKCDGCGIETLLLANNDALKTLSCSYNGLETLEIPEQNSLENLNCNSNDFMESIDLEKATKLVLLDVSYTSLESLDVSKCLKLEILMATYSFEASTGSFDYDDDTGEEDVDVIPELELDVSVNTALKELYLEGTELTKVILPDNATIEILDVQDSNVTSIVNLDKQTTLKNLFIAFAPLENLDFTANAALVQLHCDKEQEENVTGVDPEKIIATDYAGGDGDEEDGDEEDGDEEDGNEDGNTDEEV